MKETKEMIWQKPCDLTAVNEIGRNSMVEFLNIRFTAVGDDYMEAVMPVTNRTCQPFGYLHGGAGAVLAETLGSIAGNYACGPDCSCLGLDLNINHLKAARLGEKIRAVARPVQLGNTIQVWQIDSFNGKNQQINTARLTLVVRRHMKVNSETQ